MEVRHLKVLRDKYYIAFNSESRSDSEYRDTPSPQDDRSYGQQEIVHVLAHPTADRLLPMLQSRTSLEVSLGDDQFMPLGDNSPASSDARYWEHPYVGRHLLVGKALFIYWPHTWNSPPFLPNFRRMQPIR
jgi:signal peptidase I